AMPTLANPLLDFRPLRAFMESALGISVKRSLPHYARERFDKWFAKHAVAGVGDPGSPAAITDRGYNGAHRAPLQKKRGPVILWDDTFVRYHQPHIGIAAMKVLEGLGFEVALVKDRRCCGRPAFSLGNLDAAAKLGKHNISHLSSLRSATARQATLQPPLGYGSASNHQLAAAPILFLEPSCWSMFVEDYRELKIENAENVAKRCFLFEQFM